MFTCFDVSGDNLMDYREFVEFIYLIAVIEGIHKQGLYPGHRLTFDDNVMCGFCCPEYMGEVQQRREHARLAFLWIQECHFRLLSECVSMTGIVMADMDRDQSNGTPFNSQTWNQGMEDMKNGERVVRQGGKWIYLDGEDFRKQIRACWAEKPHTFSKEDVAAAAAQGAKSAWELTPYEYYIHKWWWYSHPKRQAVRKYRVMYQNKTAYYDKPESLTQVRDWKSCFLKKKPVSPFDKRIYDGDYFMVKRAAWKMGYGCDVYFENMLRFVCNQHPILMMFAGDYRNPIDKDEAYQVVVFQYFWIVLDPILSSMMLLERTAISLVCHTLFGMAMMFYFTLDLKLAASWNTTSSVYGFFENVVDPGARLFFKNATTFGVLFMIAACFVLLSQDQDAFWGMMRTLLLHMLLSTLSIVAFLLQFEWQWSWETRQRCFHAEKYADPTAQNIVFTILNLPGISHLLSLPFDGVNPFALNTDYRLREIYQDTQMLFLRRVATYGYRKRIGYIPSLSRFVTCTNTDSLRVVNEIEESGIFEDFNYLGYTEKKLRDLFLEYAGEDAALDWKEFLSMKQDAALVEKSDIPIQFSMELVKFAWGSFFGSTNHVVDLTDDDAVCRLIEFFTHLPATEARVVLEKGIDFDTQYKMIECYNLGYGARKTMVSIAAQKATKIAKLDSISELN